MSGEQNASTSPRPQVLRRHLQVLAAALLHHAGVGHRGDVLRVPPNNQPDQLQRPD